MHRRLGVGCGGLVDVGAEIGESRIAAPGLANLAVGVAEYVEVAMPDGHAAFPLLVEFLQARLRNPGPHAEHVGEVINRDTVGHADCPRAGVAGPCYGSLPDIAAGE